ncbi:MAG: helix-turn-helix domain-containing protein [Candidatus Omnitrophica bacterium]|nr:helix-turn-helix domain-containing protein [Candidatus Omnitrophota bacterium]MDD5592584.1 helix-turn-helix domain-containing protein [Candidatus Omnitrophota bacterium]
MAEIKLLTIRDASLILGVSEREVMDLVENGKLIAYKVGGVYLRFKREHIDEFKKSLKRQFPDKINTPHKYPFRDRLGDLLYFYDFYILSILVILLILIIIFRW